jgi:hypothetical protein
LHRMCGGAIPQVYFLLSETGASSGGEGCFVVALVRYPVFSRLPAA